MASKPSIAGASAGRDDGRPHPGTTLADDGHDEGGSVRARTLAFAKRNPSQVFGTVARLFRLVDIDDQVEATRRISASDRRWTVVRGSDLEEGESEGLPVWSEHVGDPVLESNRTRRVDFARFMVEALTNDALVQKAPAIVGCKTASARAHAAAPAGREAAGAASSR